jgi:oligosaccharide repeat unit polymerase
MSWWIVPTTIAVAAHFWLVVRRRGFFTAAGLFPSMQFTMAVGTLAILDPGNEVHDAYATVISLPLVLFCLTSIASERAFFSDTKRIRSEMPRAGRPSLLMLGVLGLSLLITVAYFVAVGYNLFLWGLWDLIGAGGSDLDVTSLRLRSYSGEQYFAPGYVNQFKNVMLPVTALAGLHYLIQSRSRFRWPAVVVTGPILISALLGTGQRGAFVLTAIVAVAYLTRYSGHRLKVYVVGLAAMSVPAFLLATVVLGRWAENYGGSSWWGRASAFLQEVIDRFFYTNQASGYYGYLYTHERPTQWGAEWWRALRGILPGDPGSDVSFKVFETVYGSDRGTMPLSLWGSVDYNFGLIGLILVPVILALAFHRFTVWSTSRKTPNSLDGLAQSGIHVVLATWIAGGPEYLLNVGLVAYLFLMWVAHGMRLDTPKAWNSSATIGG